MILRTNMVRYAASAHVIFHHVTEHAATAVVNLRLTRARMCLWQASVRASSRYADAVGVTPRRFRFTSDRFCFILARNFARPGAIMRFSRLRFKGLPSFGMTF